MVLGDNTGNVKRRDEHLNFRIQKIKLLKLKDLNNVV